MSFSLILVRPKILMDSSTRVLVEYSGTQPEQSLSILAYPLPLFARTLGPSTRSFVLANRSRSCRRDIGDFT